MKNSAERGTTHIYCANEAGEAQVELSIPILVAVTVLVRYGFELNDALHVLSIELTAAMVYVCGVRYLPLAVHGYISAVVAYRAISVNAAALAWLHAGANQTKTSGYMSDCMAVLLTGAADAVSAQIGAGGAHLAVCIRSIVAALGCAGAHRRLNNYSGSLGAIAGMDNVITVSAAVYVTGAANTGVHRRLILGCCSLGASAGVNYVIAVSGAIFITGAAVGNRFRLACRFISATDGAFTLCIAVINKVHRLCVCIAAAINSAGIGFYTCGSTARFGSNDTFVIHVLAGLFAICKSKASHGQEQSKAHDK